MFISIVLTVKEQDTYPNDICIGGYFPAFMK